MFIASVIFNGKEYFLRSSILTEYRERATEFKTEADAMVAVERAKKFSKPSVFKNVSIRPVA
jgi:hypothetical protein